MCQYLRIASAGKELASLYLGMGPYLRLVAWWSRSREHPYIDFACMRWSCEQMRTMEDSEWLIQRLAGGILEIWDKPYLRTQPCSGLSELSLRVVQSQLKQSQLLRRLRKTSKDPRHWSQFQISRL